MYVVLDFVVNFVHMKTSKTSLSLNRKVNSQHFISICSLLELSLYALTLEIIYIYQYNLQFLHSM